MPPCVPEVAGETLKMGARAQAAGRGVGILSVILPSLRLSVFLTLGIGILLPARRPPKASPTTTDSNSSAAA
jgi:hypothetical protein